MQGEARKLHLIEEILKIDDEAVLAEMETLISNKMYAVKGRSFADFAGIWSAEEADEMKRIIEESCEQINPDDWK
ncbi:MAG: hypothetical protein ACXVMS_10460 [Flavisolibacter sp.]